MMVMHTGACFSSEARDKMLSLYLIRPLAEPIERSFIEAGTNLDARGVNGFTILTNAIIHCYDRPNDIIELLLEHGVDVLSRDHHGMTVLARALGYGDLCIAKRLIEYNPAILDTLDNYGDTVLINAVISSKAIKFLLGIPKVRATINVQGNAGNTALMNAMYDRESIVLLLRAGADPNIRNMHDQTALDMHYESNIRNLLIQHGAK